MANSKFDFLVFGANGQDGFLMTRYLLKKKYSVIAIVRANSINLNKLKKLFKKKIKIIIINKYNKINYHKIYKSNLVNKVFFFAGFSKIPSNFLEKKKCYLANYIIFKNFIEYLIEKKLSPKILYVSSSEIFGSNQVTKRNEKSQIKPSNYYGQCKAMTQNYISENRKNNKIFISTAIAYNHESIFSPDNHIIKKLIDKFNKTKNKKVVIYNQNQFRNVSHVYDFLPIFERILYINKSDDFVLANDKNFKIMEIAKIINKLIYKNKYKIITRYNSKFNISRKADNSKIKKIFNFKPKYDIYKILKRFNSYKLKLN